MSLTHLPCLEVEHKYAHLSQQVVVLFLLCSGVFVLADIKCINIKAHIHTHAIKPLLLWLDGVKLAKKLHYFFYSYHFPLKNHFFSTIFLTVILALATNGRATKSEGVKHPHSIFIAPLMAIPNSFTSTFSCEIVKAICT